MTKPTTKESDRDEAINLFTDPENSLQSAEWLPGGIPPPSFPCWKLSLFNVSQEEINNVDLRCGLRSGASYVLHLIESKGRALNLNI